MIPHPAQETRIPQPSERSSSRIDTVVWIARFSLERDIRQLSGEVAEMGRHIVETERGMAEVEAIAVALTVQRQAGPMDMWTDQVRTCGFRKKIGTIARAAWEPLPCSSGLLGVGVGLIILAAGLGVARASTGPWQAADILLVTVLMAFAFWVHAKALMVAWRQDRMGRREMEELRHRLDRLQWGERDPG